MYLGANEPAIDTGPAKMPMFLPPGPASSSASFQVLPQTNIPAPLQVPLPELDQPLDTTPGKHVMAPHRGKNSTTAAKEWQKRMIAAVNRAKLAEQSVPPNIGSPVNTNGQLAPSAGPTVAQLALPNPSLFPGDAMPAPLDLHGKSMSLGDAETSAAAPAPASPAWIKPTLIGAGILLALSIFK